MPLTDTEKTTIEQWIASHAPKFGCPACSGKTWGMQDDLAFLPIIDAKTTRVSRDNGFPVVVLTCNTCGYTSLFSALQVGLIKQR